MTSKTTRLSRLVTTGMMLMLVCGTAGAKIKVSKLAKKLLYGDEATRLEAIQAFNKLPEEAQYRLVPDFMVALTDEDPQVRKISSRILKAMGVKTEAQIPDVQKELSRAPAKGTAAEPWAEEKALKKEAIPEARKELLPATAKPAADDKWAELKQMKTESSGHYVDLKQEIDNEKRGQVTLDATELRPESSGAATPLSVVLDSLKDPDPWVRAQAARRLAMVHPAPIQTIPTLIQMLDDKNVESRRAAAAALGSFGPLAREAIPALHKALADEDNSVSVVAAEALKQVQHP